ncbi:MAG: hypothetical protein FJW32_07025 [Acidobacteria bacterium]|nr:hypothetical protein [Acidobacteriota bacterium]
MSLLSRAAYGAKARYNDARAGMMVRSEFGCLALRNKGVTSIQGLEDPLPYLNGNVRRVNAGGSFNVASWTGASGVGDTVSATSGVLSSRHASGTIR